MMPAETLLARVTEFYGGPGRDGDAGAAAVLDRALAALPAAIPVDLEPRHLPVAELLPGALPACPVPLALALAAAAPTFRWRQNPNYSAANMGAEFMAGYGYAEFAGPKEALFLSERIRVGLLVLGPGLHYPPHAHPAEEVYHPLTPGGRWRRAPEDWRDVASGRAIHHAPLVEHETRAGAQTLLALYCWAGDTATEAKLSA
jgi:hypothetical protein